MNVKNTLIIKNNALWNIIVQFLNNFNCIQIEITLDNLALACAVDKRISVSSALAVTGCVLAVSAFSDCRCPQTLQIHRLSILLQFRLPQTLATLESLHFQILDAVKLSTLSDLRYYQILWHLALLCKSYRVIPILSIFLESCIHLHLSNDDTRWSTATSIEKIHYF